MLETATTAKPPQTSAIFPLSAVIAPLGRMPLQIFEQRYLRMVSQTLKDQSGFTIVLLKEGREVGGEATFYDIGTHVKVVDFQQLSNGLLGITVEAERKVKVRGAFQQADGLYLGELKELEEEAYTALPEEYFELSELLEELLRHPFVKALGMRVDLHDARQVGWRLLELLPLGAEDKQYLLALEDPIYRLEQVRYLIHALAE